MEFAANIFDRVVKDRLMGSLDNAKTGALALLDDPKGFTQKMMEDRIRDSFIGAGLMTDEEYEAYLLEKMLEGNARKTSRMQPMMAPGSVGVPDAPRAFINQMPNYLNTAQSVLGS